MQSVPGYHPDNDHIPTKRLHYYNHSSTTPTAQKSNLHHSIYINMEGAAMHSLFTTPIITDQIQPYTPDKMGQGVTIIWRHTHGKRSGIVQILFRNLHQRGTLRIQSQQSRILSRLECVTKQA